MVALVLADALLEKFGGDSVAETRATSRRTWRRSRSRCARGERGATDRASSWSARPASGKSHRRARCVAERSASPFRDTDADVEAAAGSAIADIFVDDGEPAFRALERAAVARALAEEHDGVLALGGGAVLDPRTRGLRWPGSTVVFLDVGLADAAPRVGFDPAGRCCWATRARSGDADGGAPPVYERLATVRVDTDGRRPATWPS